MHMKKFLRHIDRSLGVKEKHSDQTYVEFAHAKRRSFDQWCHAMNVQKDYENLRQIVLIEEFKNNLPM